MNITITQGQNIIQILYDEFVSCLKIKKALAVNWPDCAGSVGEYYAVSNFNSELRESLTNELNSALIDGSEDELNKSISKFLNLFENGEYRNSISEIAPNAIELCHQESTVYHDSVPFEQRFSGAFYPYPYDREYVIFTRPKNSINESRVNYYSTIISKGKKPKVILLDLYSSNTSDGTSPYILDGHHKILAYKKLEIEIPIIRITKTVQKANDTNSIIESLTDLLKAHELNHLILNNDENIENIKFLKNPLLTKKLDEAIIKTKRPGIGLTKLFLKINAQNSEESKKWISLRINSLKKNKYIGNGLGLNTKVLNDKNEIKHWGYFEVSSIDKIDEWLKITLPNIR